MRSPSRFNNYKGIEFLDLLLIVGDSIMQL